MREQGNPRYGNDDFSPYAGPEYHKKEHPGVSGKSIDGETWVNRDEYDEQRNFMGKGPKGYRRTDDRIYEEVCEALQDDPTVDATDIGVKVQDGIVTLEGRAHDRQEKRLAEMLVCEIPGVLDVHNEITLS
jgi:osmotically-inducible protein OsmY